MKKYITLVLVTTLLVACGKKEDASGNIDALIEAKNAKELQLKKAALQADINKIDAALTELNVKVDEALVSVQAVKDTVFNHYLEVQGNVDTKENILIQPEFSGTLVSLNAKAGQHVSKGQVLGRVDDAGLSQQLASLENQYALAKTNFDRQKNLWDKKIGSEMQYLQAQTNMITAQKGVAQLKAQLAKTIIRAPFTGTIDEVFVEKGQVVSPSAQGLMRIVNVSNMYVSTTVPETYVGKLKVGTEVDVFLTSLGKTYKGKVRQVGNFINPSNRSFGIEVTVPNPQGLLRPNQVAKLRIIDYVNKKALVVPTNVIQKDANGESYVYVASEVNGKTAKAKKVVVKTGQSSDNFTEILSGLAAEELIVTDGVNTISEGMKLNF
ncbi:efflux RND transporter periplasmic adaptor subunit [Flavobacterium stagni]|uniref:Efflux RND transporter periplasmic adaptor subunit n=1 Tax=Flavobacterium stagni TaxID=2506421 RepID=A0A4Q1KE55_9FLAO|nr:efflux RND transporter periplasmic adaptor subunit [Flavobacterium stagni]RXR24563.1 efflux RND transporter periplasmic adaptor subunit [Flavobacterium stagni]